MTTSLAGSRFLTRGSVSRRRFIGVTSAAAATLGFPFIGRMQNANSKIAIAMIACGGRGGANLGGVDKTEYIAALCDVNQRNLDAAKTKHPQAATFTDFRKVFDHAKDFDAVMVSTCEHTHAFATMLALQAGKHVYCEKPLTYNIWEARKIREAAAARPKLATQMGIQIHSSENYRRVVEIIQSGAIGKVREAHVWVSRAWGLQSKEAADRNKDIVYVTERPKEAMPVPATLDWDLWLGPAPERPFNDVYFPGPKWYRWWDFGNGTMSDLGSHFNDLPFWALKLKTPLTIEASGPPAHPEIAPASMQATYEYGARGDLPPVKLTWYQGENKPDLWTQKKIPQWGNGHLFVGDKGMLLSDYGKYLLLPEADFAGFKPPEPFIPRVKSHYDAWLTAIRNGTQPHANFEYAGWLTEANHLGNVAFRAGKKLEWDPVNLRARNFSTRSSRREEAQT
ncbi:MAG: Gfo/Idh/MocA family oxidoreductase [Verrucomicrobia bacterium]|nr:Gfo/Idh/MocA family oxidoreductase [Verrucomicrobiota bacterium]